MGWGSDGDSGDDGFGGGFGGGGFGSDSSSDGGYGNDSYGSIGNSMGSVGSSDGSSGGDYGSYGMDSYGFGNTLGTTGQSNFGSLGYGNDYGSSFGNYGTSSMDNPLGSFGNLSEYGLDTSYSTPNSLFGIASYGSAPTQYGTDVGFLGSGIKSIAQQAADQTKEGISSPTIAGWGEVTPTTAKYGSLDSALANPEQSKINQVVGYRYSNDPATQAAKALGIIGQFGALANPAFGIASPVGAAVDAYAREKYGMPQNTQGMLGSIGTALGAQAGPLGSIMGNSLGQTAGASLSGNAPAGETFGRSMFGNIANTIGSVLGGSIAGPVGAKLGSMTLGDLAKVAMAAQTISNQQQQSRDIAAAQGRNSQYANQLANLVNNPDSFQNSALFKSQREQALREGLRGLAAQGKLGSGARAYAMGNVASNIANQYYNQEANRLANLAGTSAQQVELARARANAEGARNYQLMQLASKYLS